jgi:hypothetical protein
VEGCGRSPPYPDLGSQQEATHLLATPCNGTQQLDPRHLRAVDLIALGKSDIEVARELALERSTIWRWRKDPAFQTELARRREELWSSSVDRMSALLGPTLDVLAEALDDGDRNIAMQFLKLLRVGDVALERVRRTETDTVNGSGVPWPVAEVDAQIEALSAEINRRRRAAAEGSLRAW